MRQRGFEIAKGWEEKGIHLPKRNTKFSAGYDVEAAEDITIPPFQLGQKPTLIPTGLKGYCMEDEYFMLVNRSSGPKKGLVMPNSIGIVDKDYYGNENNDGHFYFQFYNIKEEPITIHKGDVIGQVIFHKFLTVDQDEASGVRRGGFGSTDQ